MKLDSEMINIKDQILDDVIAESILRDYIYSDITR